MNIYQTLRRPIMNPIEGALLKLDSSKAELNEAVGLSHGYIASILGSDRDCRINVVAAMALSCRLELTMVPKSYMNSFEPDFSDWKRRRLVPVKQTDEKAVSAVRRLMGEIDGLRERSGIQNGVMAETLAMTLTTLERMSRGEAGFPKLSSFQRIADLLNLALVAVDPTSSAARCALVPERVQLAQTALPPPFYRANARLPKVDRKGAKEIEEIIEKARTNPGQRRRFVPSGKVKVETLAFSGIPEIENTDRGKELRETEARREAGNFIGYSKYASSRPEVMRRVQPKNGAAPTARKAVEVETQRSPADITLSRTWKKRFPWEYPSTSWSKSAPWQFESTNVVLDMHMPWEGEPSTETVVQSPPPVTEKAKKLNFRALISPDFVPNAWTVRQCQESITALYNGLLEAIDLKKANVRENFVQSLHQLKDMNASIVMAAAFKTGLVLRADWETPDREWQTVKIKSVSQLSSTLFALVEGVGSINEVARKTGISKAVVEKAVNTPGSSSMSTIVRLADFLQVKLAFERA